MVPLNQIQPGDAISVRMGGLIPVDGMIVQGEVMVNQASLTGESVPVPKGPNTMVYAGTVVEEGECIIQVSQQLSLIHIFPCSAPKETGWDGWQLPSFSSVSLCLSLIHISIYFLLIPLWLRPVKSGGPE